MPSEAPEATGEQLTVFVVQFGEVGMSHTYRLSSVEALPLYPKRSTWLVEPSSVTTSDEG